MCINPTRIRNPSNNKFERKIRPFIDVPCGRCYQCAQKKRLEWCFRLFNEYRFSMKGNYFLTLTYDEDNICQRFYDDDGMTVFKSRNNGEVLSGDDTLDYFACRPCFFKPDVSNFIRSLRDKLRYASKDYDDLDISFKYFCCSEYGSKTFRPHYHIILFNFPLPLSSAKTLIEDSWKYGFISISQLNEARIFYTTKYIMKNMFYNYENNLYDNFFERNFLLCSKNIGSEFMTEEMKKFCKLKKNGKVFFNGREIILPRYYRDKIFSDSERREVIKNLKDEFDLFSACPKSEVNIFEWLQRRCELHKQDFKKFIEDDIL